MLKPRLQYIHAHRQEILRETVKSCVSWLFLCVTVIGSLLAFLPAQGVEWLHSALSYGWHHLWLPALILLLIVLIAFMVNIPRTRAIYKDTATDIRIIIECCDILRQEGLKVIHTVDTFDAELGRIISPRSLHGAFLQYGLDRQADIDALLDEGLRSLQPAGTNPDLPGRKAYYPLGTVCPVDIDQERFCCVAFTHLQPEGSIAISKDEYVRCLKRMWRNLAQAQIRSEVINVVVMGNKFVDLPAQFSTEQKIDIMIQTFFAAAREKTCCRTLRICVHPNNVSEIDFAHYPIIIEHLAKRPVI